MQTLDEKAKGSDRQFAGRGAMSRRGGLVVLVFLLLVAPDVFAYLDPGTGSIILQGLIAAVAAIVTYFGLYWQKVKAFFQRFRRKTDTQSEDPPSDGQSPE